MAIRKIKPNTPGQRFMTVSTYEEITCTTPERSRMEPLKSNAGRNNHGRITVRHRGGGAKRQYRIVDFKRNKDGIPAKVATIEYDPNRSANIALLHYADGEKRYIIAPFGLRSARPLSPAKTPTSRSVMRFPSGTSPSVLWYTASSCFPARAHSSFAPQAMRRSSSLRRTSTLRYVSPAAKSVSFPSAAKLLSVRSAISIP